jgi:hypothetical protein
VKDEGVDALPVDALGLGVEVELLGGLGPRPEDGAALLGVARGPGAVVVGVGGVLEGLDLGEVLEVSPLVEGLARDDANQVVDERTLGPLVRAPGVVEAEDDGELDELGRFPERRDEAVGGRDDLLANKRPVVATEERVVGWDARGRASLGHRGARLPGFLRTKPREIGSLAGGIAMTSGEGANPARETSIKSREDRLLPGEGANDPCEDR